MGCSEHTKGSVVSWGLENARHCEYVLVVGVGTDSRGCFLVVWPAGLFFGKAALEGLAC